MYDYWKFFIFYSEKLVARLSSSHTATKEKVIIFSLKNLSTIACSTGALIFFGEHMTARECKTVLLSSLALRSLSHASSVCKKRKMPVLQATLQWPPYPGPEITGCCGEVSIRENQGMDHSQDTKKLDVVKRGGSKRRLQ